ncbi:hypothetical protein STVA_25460 [Allostella vacuolata]|nr:hypothetical protein STVA_25460 [Stella vacuolata]
MSKMTAHSNTPARPGTAVRPGQARAVFTVCRHLEGWAVEHDGKMLDHTSSKEEAKASANKRVRQLQDAGRPCQVNVAGETAMFGFGERVIR